MTSLTLLTALLVLVGAFTQLGFPRALALAGATSAGAAFALNDRVVIPTFYAVAVASVVWTAVIAPRGEPTTTARRPVPGLSPLVLFGVWSTCITIAAGLFFAGTPVLDSAGRVVTLAQAGDLSVSNIAQLTYLWVGIGVLALLARSHTAGANVLGLGLAVATLLNYWSLLHRDLGIPFPLGFFDNSSSFRFIDSAPGGVERFRGITPEPSALSAISIPTLVFFLALLPQVHGWRRAGAVLLASLALWNGLASTSTSFIISGAVMLGVAALVFVVRYAAGGMTVSPLSWLLAGATCISLVFVLPAFMDFLGSVISEKVGSSSFEDRSGADRFSFALTLQTLGVGVGLGSNRPSSFVAALLSQTGVIGFALFTTAVIMMFRGALPVREARPALWVAVSMLIGKIYNGPDLGDSSGLTWITLGVLAHYSLRHRSPSEAQSPGAFPQARTRPAIPRRTH